MSLDEKSQKNPQIDVGKLTDFEISMLIIERDTAQFKMNAIDELLNKIGEAKGFNEVERKEPQSFVKEETFSILRFEDAEGERLGQFQIAHKNSNLPDKWSSAFNVLRQNNAAINCRYYGPDYQFSYWLYGEDRVFRQLKKS